ncbi:MAG: iron ABC transporter permease [Propionibacteriaceae bacterium]|jgi:iron complex transport system permease protein|nr:iron ABC transporter permease [Propionibacteriaceae bacterium]
MTHKSSTGKISRALLLFPVLTVVVMLVSIAVGSVSIPLTDTAQVLWNAIWKLPQPDSMAVPIVLSTRLPRVLCAALIGAALSISGAAMQGLLKNPLADGTTVGVSGGASLGAVIAIVFGITIPGLPFGGVMVLAIVFACLSLIAILTLAYKLDSSLSTNTIILLGVIFTMFTSSVVSLLITFADDQIHSITFWLMGSMSSSSYLNAILLLVATLSCGLVLFGCSRELNAFAISEDNARHIGVNVRRVKFTVLIAVSVLIGVCVAISGTIGFVGLVTPHMIRIIVGPNHRRLLPATVFGGASFLMLADLVSRTIFSPRELPIGVVTSFVGALFFLALFYHARKRG